MRRLLSLVVCTLLSTELAEAQQSAAPMIHGAEVRVSAKKWEEAQRFLVEEAIPAYPEEAELHYWLGVVYAQGTQRNTEEAAKEFGKANELAGPEETELKEKIVKATQAIWGPLVNSAAKLAAAGKLDEAQKLLEQAVAIRPEGPEAWTNLGTVYMRQENNEKAVEAYEKALELKPDNEAVLYNLAVTYHQLGREARDAKDAAKEAAYYGKAETTYNAFLEKKPGDVDTMNNLAALYQERGDEAKMQKTLGSVAATDSANQEHYYNAGLTFLKGKDYVKAEEAFTKTISLTEASDPASAEMSAYAGEYLGLALLQLKKYDQAVDVLQKLIAKQPDNAVAHEYLGYAYRDSGKKQEAIDAFAKAEELKKAGGSSGPGAGRGADGAGTSQ
ncbi:MAG: tetratricopeptide repeat protein [Gemmatimonadetes bacterium]|nr:tetratricopeptide repeat protein [Gemmatimonadota bacterium]